MAIRVAVWFKRGTFRFGSRYEVVPFEWKAGLDHLEDAVARRRQALTSLSAESLSQLGEGDNHVAVSHDGRHGEIAAATLAEPENPAHTVLWGWLPMRWWPLGHWMVVDGFELLRDGTAKTLGDEILDRYW